MDADLGTRSATVLGLKIERSTTSSFAGIIPGIQAGRVRHRACRRSPTRKEREKKVDFVTYFYGRHVVLREGTGGPDVKGLADLCGHTVARREGHDRAGRTPTAQSAGLQEGRQGRVTVLGFPDQNPANLAIPSGRAQVGMADSPVAAYIVKQSQGRSSSSSGKAYATAPYGHRGTEGHRPGAADPRRAQAADGRRQRTTTILDKWGIQEGAISEPEDQRRDELGS